SPLPKMSLKPTRWQRPHGNIMGVVNIVEMWLPRSKAPLINTRRRNYVESAEAHDRLRCRRTQAHVPTNLRRYGAALREYHCVGRSKQVVVGRFGGEGLEGARVDAGVLAS